MKKLKDEIKQLKNKIAAAEDEKNTPIENTNAQEFSHMLERLQIAVQASNIGVWDWDVPTDELIWDDIMYRLYGLRKEDFSGALEAWSKSLHPEDKPRLEAAIQTAMSGEKEYAEQFRVIWPDGSIHFLEGTGRTFRDANGKPLRMVGTNIDITARKQAEEKLLGSERRYRRSIEMTGLIGWATRADGQVEDMPVWRIFTGQTVEEVKGWGWLNAVHPDDRKSTELIWRKALDTKSNYVTEYRVRRCDGVYVSFIARGIPVLDENGDVLEWVGVCIDISERKNLEVLVHRTAELQLARAAAESANEAKSTFLASMSHEIRTPLNGVLGMAELIGSTQLSSEQRDWLNILQLSGRMLLDIINDILDLSKIEAGKMTLEIAPFVLAPQLEAVLRLLSLKAQEKGLSLRLDVSPDVPVAMLGDALRLRQILTNLVNNAIKFTPFGSVDIEVRAEPSGIEDALEPRLHIVIRDTGIGIAPEVLSQLFQPFVQAEASTTRRFGGTGLGLSISLRLVQLMDGRIWAESTPGHGSTFHVVLDLPVATVMAEDNIAADLPLPPLAKAYRVLLAEDNPINQQMVATTLTSRGHSVTVAPNGAEALACIERASFDIILMDIGMPVMDGLEAVRRLRLRERERGLPRMRTIALIAEPSSGCNPGTCLGAGMDAYLAKPASANQLCATVENLDLSRLSPAPATSDAAKPDASVVPRRILLVEDNLINQKVACAMLARRGHIATVASNGQEALDALAREAFDLVLMDVQMPVMDGLEATRLLRARERAQGLPRMRVVAMTAGAMSDDRDACLAASMDDYLTKPFRPAALYAAVEDRASGKLGSDK